MAARTAATPARGSAPLPGDPGEPVNEVRLVGRWQGGVERELPSGDLVVTGRVVVPRPDGGVDTVDCAVWREHLRRRALGWDDGATVAVTGHLRRRFWRTPAGSASRYEVEVRSARALRPSRASEPRASRAKG